MIARRPIRIAHVTGLALAGSAGHILSLVKHCDPERFEQSVIMSDGSPMESAFRNAGVRVWLAPIDHYGGLAANLRAFRHVASILRKEQFDVVHTHTSVAAALGRVACKLVSQGRTIHMLHNYGSHDHVPIVKRVAYRAIERTLDWCTDYYVAGSRAVLDQGVQWRIFRPTKACHIYYGIDTDWFDEAAGQSDGTVREELGLTPASILVGFLGRLEPQKGCEFLVRAATTIAQQYPRVHFVVAGDGKLRPELERLVDALQLRQRFSFLGWRSDVVPILKSIDVMAVPSLWEPFGLSAAEAMYLRVPVVASRVDGLPEVVEHNRTGLLVPPGNHLALAEAINQLIGDAELRRQMGEAARDRVEAKFTVRQMCAAHEELYERVVHGESRRAPAGDAEPEISVAHGN